MIKVQNYKNLRLHYSEKLLQNLVSLSQNHYPNEFGGLLFGKYSKDFRTLTINQSLQPNTFASSRLGFERYADDLTSTIELIYQRTGDFYVGEWHTHPDGSVKYSKTDLIAMKSISRCESVVITNPILLILSITRTELLDYQFYILDEQELQAYE